MNNITTLKNGLTLITAPMSGTKTVTVLVMVGTGSKYETKANNGISHFLEHMLFKGTKKRPNTLVLSAELDGIGAEVNAFTTKEFTGYYIKANAAKINLALDIVSDMLLNSKLDEKEIEREKGVIIEEMNMYHDNPMMFVEDIFEECLYGDSPAGWDTIGTKDNILNMKRRNFTSYLENQYHTANTIVCIAGDLSGFSNSKLSSRASRSAGNGNPHENKLEKLVANYFSGKNLQKRGKNFNEKKLVNEKQAKPQVKILTKKTDQAHLALGVRTYEYTHKDKQIIRLISILLGGSMSSRLFINLRERHGLAYYVRTDAENYTDCGYLNTRAGVPLDKIDLAIKIILSEYERLKKELVSPRELKKNKDLLYGRFSIQLETSDSVAGWYARQAILLNTLGRNKKGDSLKEIATPDEFFKEMDKITSADIKRVANDIFVNDKLNLAIIGPYDTEDKFNKLLFL